MPVYEYECPSCRGVFEALQGLREAPIENCTRCGKKVYRILSAPNVNLGSVSSPTGARYARISVSDELGREKKLQKSYRTLRMPPGVKHNPWED